MNAAKSETKEECDALDILTHADAVRALVQQPDCIDDAISALRRFSARDAEAMNDLAVAYYLRARRRDQPLDYLRAWDAADHAARSTPQPAPALFNRALIEEALRLPGRARGKCAQRGSPPDAWKQWTNNEERLKAALRTADRAAVMQLIAPFPTAAERYLEKSTEPAGAKQLLATELARLTGERFPIDYASGAAPAPELLRTLNGAASLSLSGKIADVHDAAAMLEPVERQARAHGYIRLALRARVTHALCRLFEGHWIESLTEYDSAIAAYKELRDDDAVTDTRMRRLSALDGLGEREVAWREAMAVLGDAGRLTAVRSRVTLFDEVACAARDAGYPPVALMYADEAVALSGDASGEQRNTIISAAYRTRAEIEAGLGRTEAAEADLDWAIASAKKEDEAARKTLTGRTAAARGELLLLHYPARAFAWFTAALQSSQELPTIRASLLARRAEALFAMHRDADAERDLETALATLRPEEKTNIEAPAKGEEFWSAFFSRFEFASRRLIGRFVDTNQTEKAFNYAERARAFAVLDRVMPGADVDAIELRDIQAALPSDTAILEYCVLEHRSIVWIVTRDHLQAFPLVKASAADVDRWSEDLLGAAGRHQEVEFGRVLKAAYDGLLAQPLKAIDRSIKRLVIVPDGAMHSLPFAALRNPVTGRYLLEDFIVSIDGSAKLYLVSLRRDRELASAANPRVLLVGDPDIDPQFSLVQALRPLRHARHEIGEIEKNYAPNAEHLIGPEATIPRFLARARGCAVIHIAAHGIANKAKPWHSLIVLAPSANDPGALDGERLVAGKTFDHTRLVVLSACSSAGGSPIGPEGVAPLVRPLIAAGVPAVIGTLWDVDDATAESLLVSFHRRYESGLDAAAAMQAAQIEKFWDTNNGGMRSPLSWAPYQVIGYSSSPFGAARRN